METFSNKVSRKDLNLAFKIVNQHLQEMSITRRAEAIHGYILGYLDAPAMQHRKTQLELAGGNFEGHEFERMTIPKRQKTDTQVVVRRCIKDLQVVDNLLNY